MGDSFGSDYISVSDEEGNEFEFEVLSTADYNGRSYMAVVPAQAEGEDPDYAVSIFRSTMEGEEPILTLVDDEDELRAVYDIIMDGLYEDENL